MITCEVCGEYNEDEVSFCDECGAPLDDEWVDDYDSYDEDLDGLYSQHDDYC